MSQFEANTVQKRILQLTDEYSQLLHLPFETVIGFTTYLHTGGLVEFLGEFNAPDRDFIFPVRIVQITFCGGGSWEVEEFQDDYLPF